MEKLKKLFKLFCNWKFLLVYGISYVIIHGWSFVFVIAGPRFGIEWMTIAGGFWQTLIWLPNGFAVFTTLLLAIPLQAIFFKNDDELKKQLKDLRKK